MVLFSKEAQQLLAPASASITRQFDLVAETEAGCGGKGLACKAVERLVTNDSQIQLNLLCMLNATGSWHLECLSALSCCTWLQSREVTAFWA